MPWNPPSQGSKKREAMPSSAFLLPGEHKYPWKVKKGGQWVPSRSGLMAAYSRARQQGASAVAAKAARLLKSHFNYSVGDK